MDKITFRQAFCFLAELCDKPIPSEKKSEWFFSSVSFVPSEEIKRAFNVFGSRAHWPSLKEVLYECGISAPMTRDERERMAARSQATVAEVVPEERAKTEYGFWCFLSEHVATSEQEASAKLNEKTEELKRIGWNVYNSTDYWVKKQVQHGNTTHDKSAKCRMNWAFRFDGEPNCDRDAMIVRLLKGTQCAES